MMSTRFPHRGTQLLAIYPPRTGRAGKGAFDRHEQRTIRTLELMHRGIGIEHRHAKFLQHRRYRRLAHPDRAGQAEDKGCLHRVSKARNSASPSAGGSAR